MAASTTTPRHRTPAPHAPDTTLVPLTIGAYRLGYSRERAMRCLLRGTLRGECRDGRWYITAESLAEELRAQLA
jgi:hypothetical protein